MEILGQEEPLEEGMATHSNVLAWRIPWTEKLGGLQSIALQRGRHDWCDLACTKFREHSCTFSINTNLLNIDSISLQLYTLMAQMVKNLPAMQETEIRSLGWKDSLEKRMATRSSVLPWIILWADLVGKWDLWDRKVLDTTEWLKLTSLFTFMHWRRKWQPAPVFLPGESQGSGSLVGCRLCGHTESDTTEVT